MRVLRLSRGQIQVMIQQAREGYPQEICGLIAGDGETARDVLPVPNRASNPTRHFFMDEAALLKALKQIDANHQELLAVYHSHPASDPIPSDEDIQAARQYPDAICIIVSLKYDSPRLKAWHIGQGEVTAVDLLMDGMPRDELRHESLSVVQRYAIVLAALLAAALMIGLSLTLLPLAPILTPTGVH